MASLRMLKKDIDYLVEEVLADSYLTIYFHPEKKEDVLKIMEDTVKLRNELIEKANNPAEKNNRSLVKKHYRQVRLEMMNGIDGIFQKLSAVNK